MENAQDKTANLIIKLLMAVAGCLWALTATSQTLVLYPDTDDIAENKIYAAIIEGIDSTEKDVLVEKSEPTSISKILKEKSGNYDSLITLGPNISNHIDPNNIDVPWSIGIAPQLDKHVLLDKEVSIFPDPILVIDSILRINPDIKKVITVVSSKNGMVRAEKAREYAKEKNIFVEIKKATSAKEVARQWLLVSNDTNYERQAVWIGDSILLSESRAFSYLLKNSWKKKFMLVSSIATHSRRGITLGFVPDLNKYGRALLTALDQAQPTELMEEGFIQVVVNERTINHLGLRLPEKADQFIDMVIHR